MNTFNVDYNEVLAVEFYSSDYFNGASVRAKTEDDAIVHVRYEWEKGKNGEVPVSVINFLSNNGIDISEMSNKQDNNNNN